MKNINKLTFEALKEIAKNFYKAENEETKNKILEPLSSSQLKRLAALFYNLPNKIGHYEALYILTVANHKAYYENQKRRAKKFSEKHKNVLK